MIVAAFANRATAGSIVAVPRPVDMMTILIPRAFDMNKTSLTGTVLCLAFLAACKPISNSPEAGPAQAQPATQALPAEAAAQAKPRAKASPERIAQIVASGQKGLWASVTEVCPRERPIPTTTLTWNVADTGSKDVLLHIVDANRNMDRPFGGKQGPVGERETGHWLRPGMVFKLMSADGGKELGSVAITAKSC